ncbi:MAG: TVP38/TMEM64 family protein [Wenzhouxiangella sp.]|nr:MAG: TVP38/TMEM64 family protein [Wenzhouxiangella sp.]
MIDSSQGWRLGAGLILACVVLALIVVLGRLGIEPVLEQLGHLESMVKARFWLALATFVAAFVLLAMMALPVGTLFCLTGGYLFGIWIGAGAALLGASIAAVLTLAVVRRFGGRLLRRRLARSRIEPWVKRIESDADWYVALSRIIPVAPFFVVNAAAGMSNMPAWRFALASTLGLVPITLVYAAVGNGLGSLLEARDVMGPELLLEPHIGLPLAALVVLIVSSWILKKWIADD